MHNPKTPKFQAALGLSLALTLACSNPTPPPVSAADPETQPVSYAAFQEEVEDFAALVPPRPGVRESPPAVRVERVSSGVPWPRGMAWVDDGLVVLARGRHRRSGGVAPNIADQSGTLLRVDPAIAEDLVPGGVASARVRANAVVLARPLGSPFELYDGRSDTISDTHMDRPYCTLIFDPASRNLFLCGYSGVDLPGSKFRKNATDSVHRFDLRTDRWHPVEKHDAGVVPLDALSHVVPNHHYPHHDPERNAPPHGLLNGPNGGCVVEDYLYVVGKDNHCVAQYDLATLRRDPAAGPPPARQVMGSRVQVRHPAGTTGMAVFGPSAAAHHDGFLYLGYRTSSVVLRFPLTDSGDLVRPVVGELIAVFEPFDAATKRSANLIDLAFDPTGHLYVSCAKEARIWKIGKPDPAAPFYGDDRSPRPTTTAPYVDLRAFVTKRAGCGNIVFDPEGRLYICAGNYDSGTELAGAIYRATPLSR